MIDVKEILIRPATRSDALEASDLLHRLGLNVPSKAEPEKVNEHWGRLWDNNPYYTIFKEPVHYGWVMEHDQRIVGFFGCIPRVYHFNSMPIPVAIASQWGVEKEYRAFTKLLCEQFFEHNAIATKLVTTAIKPTGRIFERYHGHPVPDPALDMVHMVPLNLKKLVDHKFRTRSPMFASIFGAAAGMLPLSSAYKRIERDPLFNEIDPRELGDDFDRYWEGSAAAQKGLNASRSAAFVKWYHSTGNRGLKKRVFILRNAANTISGHASMMEEPVPENSSMMRYKIIDLLANDDATRSKILRQLIGIAYREKADVLEIHLPGMIRREDIPTSVLTRKSPQFPVFYQTTDPQMAEVLKQKENWHISAFDGDTCLM